MLKQIKVENLYFLSPHYDDVILTFGGLIENLVKAKAKKSYHILHFFSRANYQARDIEGNKRTDDKRLQYATGIRLIEELNCLDELFGDIRYSYQIEGEKECFARSKPMKEGESFEFPQGNKNSFDENDWKIYRRIKQTLKPLLLKENHAVFCPYAMKEHIDHVILRDALVETVQENTSSIKAQVFFGEDQPYTGLASPDDWETNRAFQSQLDLIEIDYPINAAKKADMVMKHYPSQVEESYREGVLNRSDELLKMNNWQNETGCERIYRWNI